MEPYINTFGGRRLNPLNVQPHEIEIKTIAHGLALCNRFAGQTVKPISVAYHSVWVSRLCDPEWRLQGLLHDASEAYLGDMTKWVKEDPLLTPFRLKDQLLQDEIFRRYGVPTEVHPSVKEADRLMVCYEALVGFGGTFVFDRPSHPAPTAEEVGRMVGWQWLDWQDAELLFLVTFDELVRQAK